MMEEYFVGNIRVSGIPESPDYLAIKSPIVFIDSNKIEKSIEVMKSEGSTQMSLAGEYRSNDLNFLLDHDLSFVKMISINKAVGDLSPLYKLSQLSHLVLPSNSKASFDFSHLPSLEVLGTELSKKYVNLDHLKKLKFLKLSKYKGIDLKLLKNCTLLERLELIQVGIQTLEGMELLVNLRELDIDGARHLESLLGISKVHDKLKKFRIWSASKLFDVHFLGNAVNLEYIQLSKFKEINSVQFLDKLQKLNGVAILPKIADGDLSPISRVKARRQ
jgi:hypothetical protein